ncbi:MAG TPA: GNAT family protein [Acidobacteriaceae bacterium]|nr:GNAT family protein [Acidobacteriaceae bacterium]
MKSPGLTLSGSVIRLEPLTRDHIRPLAAASAADAPAQDDNLYRWTVVPESLEATTEYVNTALQWYEEGTAIPFIVVRQRDNAVIGSTRFWNIEHWPWPAGHARHGNPHPDACEIGYTWYTRSVIRTGANTEAKFLMFTHAFEVWAALRVSLHTDSRNLRSQAAMERLGCKREGVMRAHKMAADYTSRDSIRFSIVAAEWPDTKEHILSLMRKA